MAAVIPLRTMLQRGEIMVDGVRLNGAGIAGRVMRAATAVDTPHAPAETATAPLPTTASMTSSALAAQGAPVDTSRVAALRAAIADGSYKADPDAIAARMLDTDLPPL